MNYFCFPEYGVCVPLRCGDVFVFNPQVEHCLSSRAKPEVDVVCMALYVKSSVVNGNDNSRDLHEALKSL